MGFEKPHQNEKKEVREQGEYISYIEAMDDLKVGMHVMIDNGYGEIVDGVVDFVSDENTYTSVVFGVKKWNHNKGEYIEKKGMRLSHEDPEVLRYLKQLNNTTEAPWRRYKIGGEVNIPRSSGAITLATISAFDHSGNIKVTWIENERQMSKVLSAGDIDLIN